MPYNVCSVISPGSLAIGYFVRSFFLNNFRNDMVSRNLIREENVLPIYPVTDIFLFRFTLIIISIVYHAYPINLNLVFF